MHLFAPATLLLFAAVIAAAIHAAAAEFGLSWVLARHRESHAEACQRNGMAPTAAVVGLVGAAWDAAALAAVADDLGLEPATQVLRSCCVASMWCNKEGLCYTHAFGARYVNQGWIAGSVDRPVYTCEPRTGAMPTISKAVVDGRHHKALVVGTNFGRDNDAIRVSIAGETCSSPDLCTAACQTCGANMPCGDDQICLSSATYGSSLHCYTYCAGPQDKSCPCGYICDSVTVIQTKGTVQRAIPTHLCTPKSFSSAGGAPCRDYTRESVQCSIPHYTALASSLAAVDVSVAVPQSSSMRTESLPAIGCTSDKDCDDKNVCTVDHCDVGHTPATCIHTARAECATQDEATLRRTRAFTYVLVALTRRNEQQEEFAADIRSRAKPNTLSERDDSPLLHARLREAFPYFGNWYDEAWLNPNGLIQLPPHTSCSDMYGTIGCVTFSTESNTIGIFGRNWDPSNSNSAKVYSDFPKSGDALMHVLFDKIRPFGVQSATAETTFSASLFTDGSIVHRYHTVRTTPTDADKIGLWGARTISTQYFEEKAPLQLVDNGIDTVYCPQSTLGCMHSACVSAGDVLKVDWEGVRCAALGEEFTVLYECAFLGDTVVVEADFANGVLSCVVPDLSEFLPVNQTTATTHVTAVKIRWGVPQALVNFRTDGRQDVVGMLYDPATSSVMYTSMLIRYSSAANSTNCGCSALAGLEAATCDSCGVCNGVNSTVDCAGACHGSAAVDRCGLCTGGTTGSHPGATCKSSPTIITDNQLALLSQTLLLLFMLCCMTFTFASCKYFVQSVFQSTSSETPPPPGLLMIPTRRGLAAEEVEHLPLVTFRSSSNDSTHSDGDPADDVERSLVSAASPTRTAQSECAICLQDFNRGDQCRQLPCGHMFHVPCVDEWLQMSLLCPMCKRNIRENL